MKRCALCGRRLYPWTRCDRYGTLWAVHTPRCYVLTLAADRLRIEPIGHIYRRQGRDVLRVTRR